MRNVPKKAFPSPAEGAREGIIACLHLRLHWQGLQRRSPPLAGEGLGVGFCLQFGRIWNPPALGVGICNPLGVESHYKCTNSILPDCKSGRTCGMGAECGLFLLKIHDIIFVIARGKWQLSVPRCKMLRAVWADSPRCVGSNSTLRCPFLYVEKTSKLC